MKTSFKHNGYSIVEIMVYIGIFAFLSIAVINSFITVLGSFSNSKTNRDLLQSGSVAMERLSREIRQAKTINLANSVFNSSPGTLELNSTDSLGASTVIRFYTSGGALNMSQDGNLIGNLLSQKISVGSIVFRRITNTNSDAIKIELNLIDTRTNSNNTASFYNTIILRGTY